MSWLRRAFSITVPDLGSYYSVLTPEKFYEWKYTQIAPKGSIFTDHLPPSDIITEGKIIVSAFVDEDKLKKEADVLKLKEDSPVDVVLRVGYMPSPQELLHKYKESQKSFQRGLNWFKEDMQIRLYTDSHTKHPHLFRISHWTKDEVTFHNFGRVKDLIEQFSEFKESLSQDAMDKTGRAYEMEEFRRYENAMTFVNNSHLHIDALKMDRLIESSGIKSTQTKTLPWKECYLELSHGAKILEEQIGRFGSNTWVQAASKR